MFCGSVLIFQGEISRNWELMMTTTWMRMRQNLKQTSRQPLRGMIKTEMVINNGGGGGHLSCLIVVLHFWYDCILNPNNNVVSNPSLEDCFLRKPWSVGAVERGDGFRKPQQGPFRKSAYMNMVISPSGVSVDMLQ